jgi:hypothetical protein
MITQNLVYEMTDAQRRLDERPESMNPLELPTCEPFICGQQQEEEVCDGE